MVMLMRFRRLNMGGGSGGEGGARSGRGLDGWSCLRRTLPFNGASGHNWKG